MKRINCLLSLGLLLTTPLVASDALPIRGLAIASPNPESVARFQTFMKEELAPRGVNLLVLRVDYDYAYASHPELRSDDPLSKAQVTSLVATAKEAGIEMVPQINLLGHQSWHSDLGKLLEVYPEFDETPHIELPETYQWPNEDGLYCKSYCPLHPDVHEVVFAMVDEIVAAFEADAFHAGMDEVFYIGDEKCPRCSGKDKAELYAGEVTKIRDHLAASGKRLWIWGDRLIDGETTGIGMWEASENDTHPAIDLIPKDVVICDWHYETAEPTPAYFALKGFDVLACPWRRPRVAIAYREQIEAFRETSNPKLAERFQGVMLTYWSSAERFMGIYYGDLDADEDARGPIESLDVLFPKPGA